MRSQEKGEQDSRYSGEKLPSLSRITSEYYSLSDNFSGETEMVSPMSKIRVLLPQSSLWRCGVTKPLESMERSPVVLPSLVPGL